MMVWERLDVYAMTAVSQTKCHQGDGNLVFPGDIGRMP
jgi:hypothetical protein